MELHRDFISVIRALVFIHQIDELSRLSHFVGPSTGIIQREVVALSIRGLGSLHQILSGISIFLDIQQRKEILVIHTEELGDLHHEQVSQPVLVSGIQWLVLVKRRLHTDNESSHARLHVKRLVEIAVLSCHILAWSFGRVLLVS